MKEKEQTLIIVKPHAMHVAFAIVNDYDKHGRRVEQKVITSVPRSVIEKHYEQYGDEPFYEAMINDFVGKTALAAVYEGRRGIVERFRKFTGPTNPLQAPKTTVRGKYLDRITQEIIVPLRNGQLIRSIVHCSESVEEANREIGVWF